MTIRLSHNLWMTFDGIGLYRFTASVVLVIAAVGLMLASRRSRRPQLLIALVWAWTLAVVLVALLPWSADWWWHRVLIAGGAVIAGRAMGMRVRGEGYT